MTLSDVMQVLQDLPSTFKRQDATYQAWQASLARGLTRYTDATAATLAMSTLANAQGKWLDVWGLLFGLPRHDSESDADYRTRVSATLVAGNGPPLAIQSFMALSRNLDTTVEESFPTVGWSLRLPPTITATSVATIATDLARVRPAGVPYDFQVLRGGLYLSTVNYFGRAAMTGAYLVNPVRNIVPPIGPSTNNAAPLLPTTFLTDTTLNS